MVSANISKHANTKQIKKNVNTAHPIAGIHSRTLDNAVKAEPEPRAVETKLNCLQPEPEPKLRIAALAPAPAPAPFCC